MLNIAICDDDVKILNQLKKYVSDLSLRTNSICNMQTFEKASELIVRYPSKLDILMLDIEMDDLDGISAANEIRKFDSDVKIIFITNMPQYAVKGYKVRAYGYLIKPVTFQDFSLEFESLFKTIVKIKSKVISVKHHGELINISSERITFVETFGRKTLIHCDDIFYESSLSMSLLEKELSGCNFLRCHTSYIVNSKYIKKYL